MQALWLLRVCCICELQRGLSGVRGSIGRAVVQPCSSAVCGVRKCGQHWKQQLDSCWSAVREMGSQRPGERATYCCFKHWLGCRQLCYLSSAQRVELGAECCCFCWGAAGQRERGCELRRAERELCWSEQRCEQRGHECQRVWARDGGERAQRCWPCGRERVRRERVAERQRACLSEWCRIRLGPACACECWCAAGQLECSCELQRAERELCWAQQRRYIRVFVCDRFWPRIGFFWC